MVDCLQGQMQAEESFSFRGSREAEQRGRARERNGQGTGCARSRHFLLPGPSHTSSARAPGIHSVPQVPLAGIQTLSTRRLLRDILDQPELSFFWFFEAGSSYVVQPGLEFTR